MSEPTRHYREPDTDRLVLRAGNADDLLAVVPYHVGFHPSESLVVLGLAGERRRLGFTVRVDLPDEHHVEPLAEHVLHALRSNDIDEVVLVAYAVSAARAEPLVDAVVERLGEDRIVLAEALRADGERWFSYLCDGPCCPAEGTPYDPSSHPHSAAAVVEGAVALPDRAALESSVAPVSGIALVSMEQATKRATSTLLTVATEGEPDRLTSMQERMRALVADYLAAPRRLTDDEAAEGAVLAHVVPVRDVAWLMMTRADAEHHLGLWRQVLRRVLPPYEPAVGCLTAFAAWLHGNGALASCALERALAADPHYPMAALVHGTLCAAVPPDAWEEVRPTG